MMGNMIVVEKRWRRLFDNYVVLMENVNVFVKNYH